MLFLTVLIGKDEQQVACGSSLPHHILKNRISRNLLINVEKGRSTMCEYRFSNLVNYTHTQLSDMNNTSFHGYFFPWTMTSEESAEYWRVNHVDANASVAMHDQNGAFVGLACIATRGLRGRCSGFSIVPKFRGTGASTLLAKQMVRVVRKQGLKTLQIEVHTNISHEEKDAEHAHFICCNDSFAVITHLIFSAQNFLQHYHLTCNETLHHEEWSEISLVWHTTPQFSVRVQPVHRPAVP
jgi:predicted acetyltransferase